MKITRNKSIVSIFLILLLLVNPIYVNGTSQKNMDDNIESEVTKISDDINEDTQISSEIKKKAEELGKTVIREAVELRTSSSKFYELSDGKTLIAEISLGYQHYEDENGEMRDIHTELVDEADFDLIKSPVSQELTAEVNEIANENEELKKENRLDKSKTNYRALQIPFDVTIPKDIKDGYSIGKVNERLTFNPVNVNSTIGKVSKNKIIYENAWNDTDLQLDVLDDSLKETILIKTEKGPHSFRFKVDGDLQNLKNLKILPAWLMDSKGEKRDVEQKIVKEENLTYMELNADVQGLTYPIYIDPTVIIVLADDGTSTKNIDATYCYNCNSYLGSSEYLTVGSANNYTNNVFIQFNLSNIANQSTIIDAKLELFNAEVSDNPKLEIKKINSFWDEWICCANQSPYIDSTVIGTAINIVQGGWTNFNVTSTVQYYVNGNENFGWNIKYDPNYGGVYPYVKFFSSEYSDTSKRPKLTISYNPPPLPPQPPLAPQVLTPNGGEVVDGLYNINWNAASDPDTVQSQLKYQVQLSQNGGATWVDLVALSAFGQTQLTYDFTSKPASINNLIQIRAYDGLAYGPWDQSNASFTIKHNQSPTAPGNLTPGSINASTPVLIGTLTPTLNWTFTDPDVGDTQSQYQVLLYNGTTIVKDTGWINSTLSSYSVPAAVLSRNVIYNWLVRTKDSKGSLSTDSVKYYFKINRLPTTTITSYSDGQVVPDNILTFNWNYSDLDGQVQSNYQILGTQDNWATVGYNSGILTGNATSLTTTPLAGGTWSFKVLLKDGLEWSDPVFRNNLSLPNKFEPNDTNTQAFPINYNQNYSTLISTSSDVDFYKYTASATGINQINMSVPTGLNYDIYVYDAAMNILAAGVRGTSSVEQVMYSVTNGNQYYIKVVGVTGNFSTSATYSFTLSKVTLQYQTIYQYDSNGNITGKITTQTS